MAEQRLGAFYEGFASWRRALSRAAPETQPVVFANAVAEVAGYVRKGLDRIVAADELTDMATSIGFDDADRVQSIIGNTFASIDTIYERPAQVDYSAYDEDDDLDPVRLDRLDDAPPQQTTKRKARGNGAAQEHRQTTLTVRSVEAFLEQLQPPDYLIDGLLQRRCIYSMTGKTGAGKTALAIYIATCVALGRSIGDMDVAQGNVLYLAGENPDDIGYRWIVLRQHMDCEHERLSVWIEPSRLRLSQTFQQLQEQAKAIGGFSLVIIDTSAAYFEGDNVNDPVQAGDHARMLRDLTKLHGGPCVLVCTHPVKRAAADDLIPLGAGAFLNEMDGNLTVTIEGSAVELHWLGKMRGPDFAPVSFELVRDVTHERLKTTTGRQFRTAIVRHLSDAAREGMDKAASGDAALILAEIKRDPRASHREYAQRLGWTLSTGKPHYSKTSRAIAKLRKAKLIAIEEIGAGFTLTDKGSKWLKKHLEKSGSGNFDPPTTTSFLDQ